MNKKRVLFIFALVLVIVNLVYFHTNTLEVGRYKKTLGTGNKKIKIAHISDLHSSGIGRLERQLFEALEQEEPDIIVITGDLATPRASEDGYLEILRKLTAPMGVFFIMGNWEYWEPILKLDSFLSQSNITNLTNKVKKLSSDLFLIGFDDSEEGNPDLDLLNSLPRNAKSIALFHSPIFFDRLAGEVDLSLAGHSHGGQIRLPFIGSFWKPAGTGQYVQGWYRKNKS